MIGIPTKIKGIKRTECRYCWGSELALKVVVMELSRIAISNYNERGTLVNKNGSRKCRWEVRHLMALNKMSRRGFLF